MTLGNVTRLISTSETTGVAQAFGAKGRNGGENKSLVDFARNPRKNSEKD
jgi:hypothetical protein